MSVHFILGYVVCRLVNLTIIIIIIIAMYADVSHPATNTFSDSSISLEP